MSHLPRESAFARAEMEHPDWTPEVELLVQIADGMALLLWAFVAANSKQRPRKPEPIRRPWDRPRRGMTIGQLLEVGGEVVSVGR